MHFSLGAVLQNVCKISKMYYGNRTYNINANDRYQRYKYFYDINIFSDTFIAVDKRQGHWASCFLIDDN